MSEAAEVQALPQVGPEEYRLMQLIASNRDYLSDFSSFFAHEVVREDELDITSEDLARFAAEHALWLKDRLSEPIEEWPENHSSPETIYQYVEDWLLLGNDRPSYGFSYVIPEGMTMREHILAKGETSNG